MLGDRAGNKRPGDVYRRVEDLGELFDQLWQENIGQLDQMRQAHKQQMTKLHDFITDMAVNANPWPEVNSACADGVARGQPINQVGGVRAGGFARGRNVNREKPESDSDKEDFPLEFARRCQTVNNTREYKEYPLKPSV